MFLRYIESDKQALTAFVKRKGHVENLGQRELTRFNDKVNACEELSYGERADLSSRFSEMVDNI